MIGKELINRGFRIRRDLDLGYYAIWFNGKTWRLNLGDDPASDPLPLPPEWSEFYDVSLGTRCQGSCKFCYTSAKSSGIDYPDPCETWKRWMGTLPVDIPMTEDLAKEDEVWQELLKPSTSEDRAEMIELKALIRIFYVQLKLPVIYTDKPFQVAIGSEGEGTIHPDFTKFLRAVYETGVIPNYTTNGLTLASDKTSWQLLPATSKYCAGVAVSYGNPDLRPKARQAIENLLGGGHCKIMIHHIIDTKETVDEFIQLAKDYGKDIHYHVLLPLMKHGRSNRGMAEGTFEYMAEQIHLEKLEGGIALGANFAPYLKKDPTLLPVCEYPSETYSKNVLLKSPEEVIITPSSFDLTPCKIVTLS